MERPIARTIFPVIQTSLPVLLLHNIDPTWPQEDINMCLGLGDMLTEAMQTAGHPLVRLQLENDQLASLLSGYDPNDAVVFNWCEEIPGIPRSGWMVAQELERQGFTYTGSDFPALVLSQDKRQVQHRLTQACIPTPRWKVYDSAADVDWHLFPAIVKPAFEHYSLGIERESVVQSEAELVRRVSYVIDKYQQPVIVEEFIDGPEFHVGVIGNGKLHMLPPAEIDFSAFSDIHDRLCTYDTNFNRNSISYQSVYARLPIDLTPDELQRMEEVVLGAYRATDCRDYARMDLRMRDGIFYILDVNHNADISPDTSLIKAAEMIGYPYGQFASLLVTLAAERHPVFGNGRY